MDVGRLEGSEIESYDVYVFFWSLLCTSYLERILVYSHSKVYPVEFYHFVALLAFELVFAF